MIRAASKIKSRATWAAAGLSFLTLFRPAILCSAFVQQPSTDLFSMHWSPPKRSTLVQIGKSRLYMSSSSSTPTKLPPGDSAAATSWEDGEEGGYDDHDDGQEDSSSSSTTGSQGDDDDSSLSNNEILDEYRAWSKALNACMKGLERKRTSLESELSKAQNVEETIARAQLLVSNLYLFPAGTKSAVVCDWENGGKEVTLTLDDENYDSASAEADALFDRARKLKRGSQVVQDLLEETSLAWQTLQDCRMDMDAIYMEETEMVNEQGLMILQERLLRTAKSTNFQPPSTKQDRKKNGNTQKPGRTNRRNQKPELGSPASNVRKLTSPGGCTVLVGRNRRGNEYLSLTVARGNDIWMHSRGCPGAHVLVMNRRGGPKATAECLQFAANLAIFYSDLRNEAKAEVSSAEPKHLLKPRGAPLGAIKVREEWQTFVGRPDDVPEDLKEAREESGQSDEYRTTDKAKHRKRTREAIKQLQAKRKRAAKEKKSQASE